MNIWNGFERLDFEFEGREAILIFPEDNNSTGKWLLKMEYWDAFPNFEIEMVKRGYYLAYIKNKHRWCCNEDLDLKKRFADFLIKEYGLDEKCIPVGMSCGGMFAVNFAARWSEYVSVLYLDAPVLNLLSCPADLGVGESGLFEEFQSITGMTMSELICFREHPIDKMNILSKADIPIAMVYGKADKVVPYCENGAVLEKYYNERGNKILTVGKEGCGHHPHGLENPKPVIDFITKNSK